MQKEIVKIREVECELFKPTIGNDVINISPALKQRDAFFYDPGLTMTASCSSKITYIDGDKGVLMHRGYLIQDIVRNKTFFDTVYLILKGSFPNEEERKSFIREFNEIKVELSTLKNILNAIPEGNNPMSTVMALVSTLSGLRADIRKTADDYWKCLDLIKNFLYIVSMAGCKLTGKKFEPVEFDGDYTASFAKMFLDKEIYENSDLINILDKILTLHIDHEQNASTSTVRMIASTKCDLYGCVTGGVAALWGPLHGGANEAVLKMLHEIGSVSHIEEFLNKVKAKQDNTKLMGFGHRVYKNYDPRASVLKESISKLSGIKSVELDIALKLEQIALSDDYFISRKLFPNVDFYSGIIYKAFNIPEKMFTSMFALSRIVGWCSQWLESKEEDGKIWRPRQLYMGEVNKKI